MSLRYNNKKELLPCHIRKKGKQENIHDQLICAKARKNKLMRLGLCGHQGRGNGTGIERMNV